MTYQKLTRQVMGWHLLLWGLPLPAKDLPRRANTVKSMLALHSRSWNDSACSGIELSDAPMAD